MASGNTGVSNIIIISDVQENIPSVMAMVEELDKPIANINISVRFIESESIQLKVLELIGQGIHLSYLVVYQTLQDPFFRSN